MKVKVKVKVRVKHFVGPGPRPRPTPSPYPPCPSPLHHAHSHPHLLIKEVAHARESAPARSMPRRRSTPSPGRVFVLRFQFFRFQLLLCVYGRLFQQIIHTLPLEPRVE